MNVPPLLLQLLGQNLLSSSALWLITGITFLGLSLLIPRPSISAMGVAAILTGIISLLVPYPYGSNLTLQLILWGVIFIVQAVLLRRLVPPKVKALEQPSVAQVVRDIPPGGIGQVDCEGTLWNARCQNPATALNRHDNVRIVHREGTTLIVVPSTPSDPSNNIPDTNAH